MDGNGAVSQKLRPKTPSTPPPPPFQISKTKTQDLRPQALHFSFRDTWFQIKQPGFGYWPGCFGISFTQEVSRFAAVGYKWFGLEEVLEVEGEGGSKL